MRAVIVVCALAALLSSRGTDAGLGDVLAGSYDEARLSLLKETFTRVDYRVDIDHAGNLPSRPQRRMREVSAVAAEDAPLPPGVGSDLAVHTRIQTCQGIAVTITSFGGGSWDQYLDSFCDEASTETAEPSETP